jgi:cytoskeletal protein RodZ
MSDEFDNSPESSFSPFWPILIVVVGLVSWFGIQDYELNRQRSAYSVQIQNAIPSINQAQSYANRYVSLMKDLVETSQKNSAAAQIVKDAMQAGWIKVQPNATNGTATPAAPAAPSK